MPIFKALVPVLLGLLVCASALAEDKAVPSFSDEQLEFFEAKVRPVLANHCYACHSHEAKKEKKNKGGFYLDSRQGVLEAYLAEPGKPADSLMIQAVHYTDPDMQMPPKGKLPEKVIKDLEKWVEMGMPWPMEQAPGSGEAFDLAARKKAHWAWQEPKRSGKKGIDTHIDARLAEAGLQAGPTADRATLIRRVTLDLTGLPPTPKEIKAFVSDESPEAYEQLVDRLLASPRYGEKWARHWLDLVRYAESYGHEFDYDIPHAWKYRDYVIRAINDDVPYDRFVKEHIAGDLIAPRTHPETKVNEAIKATGWWFMHEQTHAPTDVRLHEANRIDNQLDVMSKAFLGVTVACTRCHDHKFDAISNEDYYSLAGYMQSSRQQEAYLDPGGKIEANLKRVHSAVLQGQRAFSKRNAKPLEPTTIDHNDTRLFEDFNGSTYDGWHTTGWAWGDRPTVPGQWDPTSGKAAPVLPGVAHSGLLGDQAVGTLWSPEFDYKERHIWLRVKGKGLARFVIDSYTMSRFNGLLFEGLEAKFDTKGKWQWVRLSAKRDFYHDNGDHRGHLEIVDDDADAHVVIDEVRFGDKGAPPNPTTPDAIDSVSPDADAGFAEITKRFNVAASKTPGPERVLAITDGSGEDSYLHIRGSWHGRGEDLPRRFLTALGGEDGTVAPKDGSGRADLAKRIADPGNPLTARVQVNRLWHHLFGRGIVPTVDNFGVLGQLPSHPELLDELAIQFVEQDNWSNKAMIKRIVMSRAYQRSSDKQSGEVEEKDPQNLLLRRQNIRRMTSEMLRDTILFVSGSLNEKRFGPSVPVHLTAFMQGRGKPKSGPLDGQGRRSIYTSVRRNFLSPMMLSFDTPIPFSTVGRRNVTNVPAQSLTLMNDPFVHDQAKKWAKRLMQDGSKTTADRVDRMFTEALGRSATAQEHKAIDAYIQAKSQAGLSDAACLKNEAMWYELSHMVFNLKGFIYVR